MGIEHFRLFPFLLPCVVLMAATFVLPVESLPGAVGLEGDWTASLAWAATATVTSSEVALDPAGNPGGPLVGEAQAYGAGLVAAAFLVGVVLVTRGRFFP